VLRRFAEVDLGLAAAPYVRIILRFRHLLWQHDLGGEMVDTVTVVLNVEANQLSGRFFGNDFLRGWRY
jgi:hypothetical protein